MPSGMSFFAWMAAAGRTLLGTGRDGGFWGDAAAIGFVWLLSILVWMAVVRDTCRGLWRDLKRHHLLRALGHRCETFCVDLCYTYLASASSAAAVRDFVGG
eukprot:12919513-Prorocentrum_lima.AAC.1